MNSKGRSIHINIGKECLIDILFCVYMKFFFALLIFFLGGWFGCTALLVTDASFELVCENTFLTVLFDESTRQKNFSVAWRAGFVAIPFFFLIKWLSQKPQSLFQKAGVTFITLLSSAIVYAMVPGVYYSLYSPKKTSMDEVEALKMLFDTFLPATSNLIVVLPIAVVSCVIAAILVGGFYKKEITITTEMGSQTAIKLQKIPLFFVTALLALTLGLHVSKKSILDYMKGPPEPTEIEQPGAEKCCTAAYKALAHQGYVSTNGTMAVVISVEELCQSRCSMISDCLDECERVKNVCRTKPTEEENGTCRKNYDFCRLDCP